jgi:hypothetical protein
LSREDKQKRWTGVRPKPFGTVALVRITTAFVAISLVVAGIALGQSSTIGLRASATVRDAVYVRGGLGPGVIDNTAPTRCLYPADLAVPIGCQGRYIYAFGNAATASHVVIRVFGIANDYPSSPTDKTAQVDGAKQINARIDQKYPADRASTAVISWLGYDSPPTDPLNFQPALIVGSDEARVGGNLLAAFIRHIRAVNTNPNLHITVIGHSYGSIVTAYAARTGVLRHDTVVFVGSPGVDVSSASQIPVAHLYVGRNPNDLVPDLATPGLLADAEAWLEKFLTPVGLQGYLAFTGPGHNRDPSSPAFLGSIGHRFGTGGDCGHTSYFENKPPGDWPNNVPWHSQTLDNLAAISVGDFSHVTPETRPPVFSLVPGPGLPTINDNIADWCGSMNSWLVHFAASAAAKLISLGHSLVNTAGNVIRNVASTVYNVTTSVVSGVKHTATIIVSTTVNTTVNVATSVWGFVSSHLPAGDTGSATDARSAASQQKILIATGHVKVTRPGRHRLQLVLTRKGRALLARYKRLIHTRGHRRRASLRITITVHETIKGGASVTATRTRTIHFG